MTVVLGVPPTDEGEDPTQKKGEDEEDSDDDDPKKARVIGNSSDLGEIEEGGSSSAPRFAIDRLPSWMTYTIPRWVLPVTAVLLVVTGTMDNLLLKQMNKTALPNCNGCPPLLFDSPMVQALFLFIGEAAWLPIYFISRCIAQKRGHSNLLDMFSSRDVDRKAQCPKFYWVLTMALDCLGTVLINHALVFAQASTVQMLRTFSVIITALLSLFYLRVALRVNQWIAVTIVTTGMSFIISSTLAVDLPPEPLMLDMRALAVGFALFGTLVHAIGFVVEEKLLRTYRVSPFEAVGWMGTFGLLFVASLLLVGHLRHLQVVDDSLYQVFVAAGSQKEKTMLWSIIGYTISVSIFRGCAVSITKLACGLVRAVAYSARTAFLWVVELGLGWSHFRPLNFTALLVLLLGVFCYNYNYFPRRREGTCGHEFDAALRKPVYCLGLKDPDRLATKESVDDEEILKEVAGTAGER